VDRRELIRWLVSAAGLTCLEGLSPDDLLAFGSDVHQRPVAGQGFRALNAHAQRTVTLAAERIIPKTDTPGATDAGVVSFMDKMLSGSSRGYASWIAGAERCAAETSRIAARLNRLRSSPDSTARRSRADVAEAVPTLTNTGSRC
jgi:hypothetical protein